MNPGSKGNRLRRKPEHHLLKRLRRILDPDLSAHDLLCEILRNKRGRGARFAEGRKVTRVAVERDLTRSRLGERSRATDDRFYVARHFAATQFRQLSQLYFHDDCFERSHIFDAGQRQGNSIALAASAGTDLAFSVGRPRP